MKKLLAAIVLFGSMAVAQPAQAALFSTTTTTAKSPPACSAGYVNISFDDSPTQYTTVLLSTLKSNGLHATFFMVNDRMAQYPTYVKNIQNGGHQIANHTPAHADLTQADSATWDLVQTQYYLIQQTGVIPQFYRPPYGATNPEVSAQAKDLGLTEVIWTVDTVDWSGVSTAEIVATAKNAKAGDFILMHDGYPNTINALPQIAKDLKARGLCTGKIVVGGPTNAWEGLDFNATVAPW